MRKKVIALIAVICIIIPLFSGCLEEQEKKNHLPVVAISYPSDGDSVSKIVQISGFASDPDDDETLKKVEVMIGDDGWEEAEGTTLWKYEWDTYDLDDGIYVINVRAWDGADYSEVKTISVNVFNPEVVESDAHKWAVFISAANFPVENESKLGNGALYLAEEMAGYFIENFGYPTSNIVILFDDGYIRKDNGLGEPIKPLMQRYHKYDITYAGAYKKNVISTIQNIVDQANQFDDSEVFIWLSGHGSGDSENTLTGDKILDKSAVYLWGGETIEDREFGVLLSNLKSKKTCIIVDSCFSGGFADRTIYDFPTLFLLRSKVPRPGRVVITGSSKFRTGFASTTEGPLFSILWFNGITSGDADGFRPGFLDTGKPSKLAFYRDGKVSVEEAFYYARYVLRTNGDLKEFSKMEPQINDQYPNHGPIRRMKGLDLGE